MEPKIKLMQAIYKTLPLSYVEVQSDKPLFLAEDTVIQAVCCYLDNTEPGDSNYDYLKSLLYNNNLDYTWEGGEYRVYQKSIEAQLNPSTEWLCGYKDYYLGRIDNPYPSGNKANEWGKGWDFAEEKYEKPPKVQINNEEVPNIFNANQLVVALSVMDEEEQKEFWLQVVTKYTEDIQIAFELRLPNQSLGDEDICLPVELREAIIRGMKDNKEMGSMPTTMSITPAESFAYNAGFFYNNQENQ